MTFAMIAPVSIYLQLIVLIVVISMVYSATRYDDWESIFVEAYRWGRNMFLFLAGIGVCLFLVGRWNEFFP